MPSRSVKQQKFFGMVMAGKMPKPKGMTMMQVKKFAMTKTKGLPKKTKK